MTVLLTEELLIDLKRGKEEAFTTVFNDYFPRLCRFACSYLADEPAAKNIVQDVFLKLWENRRNIRENASVFSYLLTMTRNSCLDYLKHRQVELKFIKQNGPAQSETELSYYALKRLEIDLLDYKELVTVIDSTIEKLPPQCQQVFRLSRFENLTNAEISEKLGISRKAVEANITRAIKILRHELKDYITVLLLLNIPIN